ncbi:serine hydrolase domain-containing protein [Bacteroidota bacterium]
MKSRTAIFLLVISSLIVLFISGIKSEADNAENKPIEIENEPAPIPLPTYVKNYLSFIETEVESSKTVGAALSIVQDGDILVQKGYGYINANNSQPVNEHTVFRLASVSKGFAGVLAGILDEDSIIGLDDHVVDYLPTFRLKNQLNTDSLTIRHTLSHTTGLVPHSYDNLIEERVPEGDILEKMDDVDISAIPGKIYSYQNVMFSLIDTLLRIQTEKDYSYHLAQKIFEPLGMENASTGFLAMEEGTNIAHPHVRVSGGYVPVRLNKGYYNVIPAAGVNASISDLSIWLQALLGYHQDKISSSITSLISTPYIQTPLKRQYTRRWGKLDEKYYSLGWRIYDYRGIRIVYHGGYVRGYRAEIAFCPEEDIGIAFLQNSPNRLASQSIPVFFNYYIDMMEGVYDKHIHAQITPMESIFLHHAGERIVPAFP